MVYMGNVEDMTDEGGSAVANEDPVVTLQPFVHQVGGHTRMLLLDSATICKPLIARELNFYRSIPKDIKEFTPSFKGVIQVCMEQDRDFVTLRNISPSSSVSRNLAMDQRRAEPDVKNKNKNAKECLSVKVISEESPRLSRLLDKGECSRSDNPNESYFLMLENVASEFYRPCILDLKMGTRQHGDDAPEEKRHRHMAKCAASTSASLGVRVCGMQVYQADLGMYLCKDKYFGRRLDEDGFKQALHEFFHNGFTMRTQVICQVIEKLRRLRRVVEKQNSYRFYSSSLLILYEGCVEDESGHCGDSCCDSEMEMSNGSWDSEVVDACRRRQHHQQRRHQLSAADDVKSNDSIGDSSIDSESADDIAFHGRRHSGSATVDVRMIDFAHATYEGYMGDAMVHRGPDNGYILGLDNLCRVLYDILAESENDKE